MIGTIISGHLYAEEPSAPYYELREKEIYQFCLKLFDEGEYYRAITEAKRYIAVVPGGKNIEEMYLLIANAYLLSEEWSEAVENYDRFIISFPDSAYLHQVTFSKAICLIKMKDYKKAEILFQKIIDDSDPSKKTESVLWKILLLINENRFEEIDKLLDEGFIRNLVKQKIDIIQQTIRFKKKLSYKSPRLAGAMSAILPGSGQFYIERYKDGTYSFILNALFIWGAYAAFENDNIGLGCVMTIFEAGWYTGSVYGAVSGAHKYNRKIDSDIFKRSVENFGLTEYEIRRTPSIVINFQFTF